MAWEVKFVPKAEEEFLKLPDAFRSDFLYFFKLIRDGGISSLAPHHFKYIEDGIWELRARNMRGIARSLYVTEENQIVRILLTFVKKTRTTPRDKIELAMKRRDDFYDLARNARK